MATVSETKRDFIRENLDVGAARTRSETSRSYVDMTRACSTAWILPPHTVPVLGLQLLKDQCPRRSRRIDKPESYFFVLRLT